MSKQFSRLCNNDYYQQIYYNTSDTDFAAPNQRGGQLSALPYPLPYPLFTRSSDLQRSHGGLQCLGRMGQLAGQHSITLVLLFVAVVTLVSPASLAQALAAILD